jgi:hypothetical protein
MEIEASAAALAPEQPISEAPVSEMDELAKVWEDHQPQEPDAAPDPEPVEAKKADKPVAEPETAEQPEQVEKVEAPTELPKSVRDVWDKVPEEARESYLTAYRDLGNKLREQGRQMQGIAPIRDVLTQAVQELPSLANMRPEDAAREILGLAKISNDFSTRPVETMMGLIKQHGLERHVAAALSGQNTAPQATQEAQYKNKIAALERQVQDLTNPDTFSQRVHEATQMSMVRGDVDSFIREADHWNTVEPHMANLVAAYRVSMGDSASPKDVLKSAYEHALSMFVPEAKATPAPAPEQAATVADPEKTQAALKAKSVNVSGTSTGKHRSLTEEQELAKVWEKMQAS